MPETELATIKIRVRISDINYGNHVGNDAFVSILHEARMQWLQHHGYTELNAGGTGLIMGDIAIEFKNESFYGDTVEVAIFSGEISRVSFELFYRLTAVRNNKQILLANAKTGMVHYSYEIKKPVSLSDEIKIMLAGK